MRNRKKDSPENTVTPTSTIHKTNNGEHSRTNQQVNEPDTEEEKEDQQKERDEEKEMEMEVEEEWEEEWEEEEEEEEWDEEEDEYEEFDEQEDDKDDREGKIEERFYGVNIGKSDAYIEYIDGEHFVQKSGAMSKLPMEIFLDILSRLPVKSIAQCRWVCKAWYNSLQHPLFFKLQHVKAIESNSYFVLINDIRADNYYLIDLESSAGPQTIKLNNQLPRVPRYNLSMDSCNGLILVREPPFMICNPITGDFVTLPKSPNYNVEKAVACGFGYDPSNEEYKVIRVVEIGENYREAEVYSFSSGRWTIVNVPYVFEGGICNAFVNGAFHWVSKRGESGASEFIVSFKIVTNEFHEYLLPPCTEAQNVFFHRLFVFDEHLCVCRSFYSDPSEFWVMKSYGGNASWSKDIVIRNIYPFIEPYEPLKVMKNGMMLLVCYDEVIGYYDSIKEEFDLIFYEDPLPDKRCFWQTLIHVGSLISPRNIGRLTNRRNEGKAINNQTTPLWK